MLHDSPSEKLKLCRWICLTFHKFMTGLKGWNQINISIHAWLAELALVNLLNK